MTKFHSLRVSYLPYFISSALLVYWAVYTIFGLTKGYSYWFDELFSVSAAANSLSTQIKISLLNDVHPPLYQLLLSAWMGLFGTAEAAARSLSAVSLLLSLPALLIAKKNLKEPTAILSSLFILSNIHFFYYAQEARSYGFLLFLSLWATILFIVRERRYVFLFLIALFLTHFFGLLLAIAIALWMLFENWSSRFVRWGGLITIATAAVWPAIYVGFGNASNVIGGNFWIKSSPAESIINSLNASFPTAYAAVNKISYTLSNSPAVFVAILAIICLLVIKLILIELRSPEHKGGMAIHKLIYLLLFVSVAAAIVSIHTPISTVRNHIVIVPAASILLAYAVTGLLRASKSYALQSATMLSLIIYALVASYHVNMTMQSKLAPLQNWKQVSNDVTDLTGESSSHQIFQYLESTPSSNPEFELDFRSFYFGETVDVELITLDQIQEAPRGSIIVFGHTVVTSEDGTCRNAITEALDIFGRQFVATFADQSLRCRNGYIVLEPTL